MERLRHGEWERTNERTKERERKRERNKAGYMAVRCVPRRDRHICTRPFPAPHPSFLPLPSLDIPSSSEVELTRFRVFEAKALRTDRRTDGRTDRPSYRDARTHLKKAKKRRMKREG